MPTVVEPFIARVSYILPPAPGRKMQTIQPGTQLYALRHTESDLLFIWVYLHKAGAEDVASRAKPEDATDIALNWRRHYHQLKLTAWDGKDRLKPEV